jgi:hypothetical protein
VIKFQHVKKQRRRKRMNHKFVAGDFANKKEEKEEIKKNFSILQK